MTQEKSRTGSKDVDPEVWLDLHGDALYRFALTRVQDSHIAEDLVQETLVSGIKSIRSFKGRSSMRTWLMSILRRRIADHFKLSDRQSHFEIESLPKAGESDHKSFADNNAKLFRPEISTRIFESAVEMNEFWDVVRGCSRELPIHFQEAFLLRVRYEHSTLAELCAKLGITQTNLSVRLYRARLLVRACMERNWLNR